MTLNNAVFAGIDCSDPGSCWLWPHGKSKGYGIVRYQGRIWRAHRLAFFDRYGGDVTLANICGNRHCVNYDHWKASDEVSLTPGQIAAIRDELAAGSWGTGRALAQKYGVSESYISRLRL